MPENTRKTILLVEDEAIIAMAEKMALEKRGYTVLTSGTGEEAIEAVKKTTGIDLILMDIDLGRGMDGTRAAEIILGERDLPVVFLSSHAEPEIVEKTEKITSYGYIVKNSGDTVMDASIKMAFKLFDAKIATVEREDALRESEQRFKVMLDVVPDMISIHDPDMNILYSNWQGFAAVDEARRKENTKCYATYRGGRKRRIMHGMGARCYRPQARGRRAARK